MKYPHAPTRTLKLKRLTYKVFAGCGETGIFIYCWWKHKHETVTLERYLTIFNTHMPSLWPSDFTSRYIAKRYECMWAKNDS